MSVKHLSNFDEEFNIPSTALYINRTHPFICRNKIWRIQCFILAIGNALCLFFLTFSIFLHDIKDGKYTDACKNLAMLILSCNSNLKYYLMLYHRHSIANLINTINRDYALIKDFSEDERNIIVSYCKKSNRVSKYWMVIPSFTSSLFPGKAFYLMAYYYCKGETKLVPMFDVTFPFFIERFKHLPWAYGSIFCLCLFFAIYVTFVYVGFEPLIPIFTLHTCGQLDLLSKRIKTVISESQNEKEILLKLKDINIKLQELYKIIDDVQNNFMILMEFNMKTTTILLPCTAFQMVETFRTENMVNVEVTTLFVAAFLHFLSPCYFSDLLMETSERLRVAIYSCGWERCRRRAVRSTILLMLTRVSRPLSISTVFYNISLGTFSTMCRQAYAIFNVMTAAWEL